MPRRIRSWSLILLAMATTGLVGLISARSTRIADGTRGSVLTEQNVGSSIPAMTVHASTIRPYDHEHCFQQRDASAQMAKSVVLYFDVYTNVAANQVYFSLYNYHDPVTDPSKPPKSVIDHKPFPLSNGYAHIAIDDSLPPHLGPGPYMAMLTATSSVAGASSSSANSLYYYETWKSDPTECWH